MTGTWINIAAVLVGGGVGLFFGQRVPSRIRHTIFHAIGMFTLLLGVRMFLASQNPLYVLGSLLLGGGVGELLRIEDRLASLGSWFERRWRQPAQESRFVEGFLAASLLFCVGPMTILGSLQDGLTGDYQILATKAMMDGFSALAFAATMGVGVLFSTVVILVYQGGLTLFAAALQPWMTEAMMAELTAAGGVLLAGLAVSSLLELKPLRVGNWIPALLFAPLLVAFWGG